MFETISPLVFAFLLHPQLWPQQLVVFLASPLAFLVLLPVAFPLVVCLVILLLLPQDLTVKLKYGSHKRSAELIFILTI